MWFLFTIITEYYCITIVDLYDTIITLSVLLHITSFITENGTDARWFLSFDSREPGFSDQSSFLCTFDVRCVLRHQFPSLTIARHVFTMIIHRMHFIMISKSHKHFNVLNIVFIKRIKFMVYFTGGVGELALDTWHLLVLHPWGCILSMEHQLGCTIQPSGWPASSINDQINSVILCVNN